MTDRLRTSTRAVVIGGSLAGMLAAAALKDGVDSVEVIEAHALPSGPEPRAGVPQAAHIHPLLSGGADAIEALLPGTIGQLMASGAHRVPMTTNMVYLSPEGWYRRWRRNTQYLVAAGRDLTDSVVRERVLKDPRVTVRPHCRATGLLGDAGRVTGVRLRGADGTETELSADLVVDASGRSTRTPHWLAELGITGLAEDRIDSGLAYASRIYRAPFSTSGWPVVNIVSDPRRPGGAGSIVPIEGDRWHVSLSGPPGARPGKEPAEFEAFARGLRHPLIADLLAGAEPLTDVTVTHSTVNRRHYYERLGTWPDGLVALGDSVAGFNPVYGHGMSAAAQGALALHRLTSRGLADGLARRAQRAVARPVGVAWSLAVGQDIHRPDVRGRRPSPADRLLHRYVSRLSRTAVGSFRVATALTEVLTLQAAPAVLLRPDILLAAAAGPLRPPVDGPVFTEGEHRLLRDAGISLTAP
ncbi:NAD(P)/FAD-dependent oxidoreductase [Streptomyces sp. NPDC018057]|uniref:NAD(P)/FAD-dependent oxidoreductase n=1 Tax=unclassified Streptomyces TaxID=2593676 RepID=UPI0037A44726